MNLNTVVPKYSIVIPMYNRENLISRALNSCLQQEYADFEIIVIDDCSTDNSINVVKGFQDSRINLVRHEKNMGVGPARNTGADNSKGTWIIWLDSDDELLVGALQLINKHIATVEQNIFRLAFMYQLDNGEISPSPALVEETWDYSGYIRWMGKSKVRGDFCNVLRREAFAKVRYPSNSEASFHLDFAKNFLTRSFPIVIGKVHFDAQNRSLRISSKDLLSNANKNAEQLTELLERHAQALKMTSPSIYYEYVRGLVTLWFMAGYKFRALHYALLYLRRYPFAKRLWIVIIFGLIDMRALAWLKSKAAP